MRAHRPRSPRLAAVLAALLLLAAAGPSSALDLDAFDVDWEGSRAQQVTSTALDLMIVRPLATCRVIVGAGLFLPAALLSLPMGREGYDGAYDTFIAEPTEYAFERKMGEL